MRFGISEMVSPSVKMGRRRSVECETMVEGKEEVNYIAYDIRQPNDRLSILSILPRINMLISRLPNFSIPEQLTLLAITTTTTTTASR